MEVESSLRLHVAPVLRMDNSEREGRWFFPVVSVPVLTVLVLADHPAHHMGEPACHHAGMEEEGGPGSH